MPVKDSLIAATALVFYKGIWLGMNLPVADGPVTVAGVAGVAD